MSTKEIIKKLTKPMKAALEILSTKRGAAWFINGKWCGTARTRDALKPLGIRDKTLTSLIERGMLASANADTEFSTNTWSQGLFMTPEAWAVAAQLRKDAL